MDGTAMMSTRYDLKPAKKVFLYRNGVTDTEPKCLVVNDRQVRDFSSFLSRATSGLRAPVAIRNIYTPAGGHKIKRLDDLESGRYYVAGGTEHFKKVKYGNETKRLLARRQTTRGEIILPTRALASIVIASARYKRPVEKPFVIHVFRNGDERYRGARILIPRRMMGSWEYVLELVTQKSRLITPAKRLCTLDGRLVHAVSELQDGGKYVALVGTKGFQKVSYCAIEEKKSPFRTAAIIPKTVQRMKKLPPRLRAAKQAKLEEPEAMKPPVMVPSHKILERRKSRPFAGRKNKEGRERAVEDHRADSIFGGSPVRPASPFEPLDPLQASPLATYQKPKTLDTPVAPPPIAPSPVTQPANDTTVEEEVIEDLSTSLPAEDTLNQSNQSSKSATEDPPVVPAEKPGDVEEVLEGEGEATDGDKSIEDTEPVEVAEEIDEGQKYGKANEQTLKELESQPLQNSIDLSLQRNKQVVGGSNHSQGNSATVSKRSSAKSKQSSRKTSARKSRPQSVDKVNSSRTHSVLNGSRPESKATQNADHPSPEPSLKGEEETTIPDERKSEPASPVQISKTVTPVQNATPTQSSQRATPVQAEQPATPVQEAAAIDEESKEQAMAPDTQETSQPDNPDESKDEVPEEIVEDTVDNGEPTEPGETTFVIEDTPTDTQS